ncbi:MAG: exopolyphosphatase [Candidatus Marinimicrobia bacterium]|nr:exopolyphosphatase [Candidatus Neomarinimicrobiota bacterium]MCH7858107.1 exopolyphosphatase [Candidatus Neomarinimicrobiota bacterium]
MKAIIRGDLDGIVCATLLKAAQMVDTVEMVRIRDILEGKVTITQNDIVCNLPFQPEAYMWFDHHSSEVRRVPEIPPDFRGAFNLAPSTAGVVYQYLLPSHPELEQFEGLVRDTDILDSADLTLEEVQHPQGNIRLGLLLDPRTRLAADEVHRASYQDWKGTMPDLLLTHTAGEILDMPNAQQWCRLYKENQDAAIESILENSHLDGNVIFSEFRGKRRFPVNRFIIYSLPEFREGNISVEISDGEPGVYTDIAVGHSIFNRTSMVDVGDLCAWYGGGGHRTVGVCRPSVEEAEQVLREIISACKEKRPVA